MSRADVNFRAKEAGVAFDPAQVSVEQMIEAVARLGFRASLKAPPPSVPRAPR
ncbi:MAG: heavy-metal-associated domain-containing protein [Candidatus Rokubacteria bacterium]|nr:heavy-metal-associated domain-containing protein [Candidatus Rokubacteria bacterium]